MSETHGRVDDPNRDDFQHREIVLQRVSDKNGGFFGNECEDLALDGFEGYVRRAWDRNHSCNCG